MHPTPLRIGIVDYHGDFGRMIADIIPTHHTVLRIPPDAPSVDVDLLVNHHEAGLNDRHHVPFLVLPYGTVAEHHVYHWNTNPHCVGVIDMSNDLARRFPQIAPPIFSFRPFHPNTPTYDRPGDKIISLIARYQERYPDAYHIACSLTPYVFGNPFVPDLEALQMAKWLLHLKPDGAFVCNAVMKALACGVPVIMDTLTWQQGYFNNLVIDGHNGIVLPIDEIGDFLQFSEGHRYPAIKQTCVAEAASYKHGFKWPDGWWWTR